MNTFQSDRKIMLWGESIVLPASLVNSSSLLFHCSKKEEDVGTRVDCLLCGDNNLGNITRTYLNRTDFVLIVRRLIHIFSLRYQERRTYLQSSNENVNMTWVLNNEMNEFMKTQNTTNVSGALLSVLYIHIFATLFSSLNLNEKLVFNNEGDLGTYLKNTIISIRMIAHRIIIWNLSIEDRVIKITLDTLLLKLSTFTFSLIEEIRENEEKRVSITNILYTQYKINKRTEEYNSNTMKDDDISKVHNPVITIFASLRLLK